MSNLKHYIRIFLEGVRKTINNMRQNAHSLDRDLNPGVPEYGAGVQPTRSRCSAVFTSCRDSTILSHLDTSFLGKFVLSLCFLHLLRKGNPRSTFTAVVATLHSKNNSAKK
jgi:hypothetical protein